MRELRPFPFDTPNEATESVFIVEGIELHRVEFAKEDERLRDVFDTG